MAISYNGLKLVWLKQFASNAASIIWTSPAAGDIGSFVGGATVLEPLRARVINGEPPVFSLQSGSLPLGLSLDQTGGISGILNNVSGSYSFTLRASSGAEYDDRDFTSNVSLNLPPVWNTMSGSLGQQFDNTPVLLNLSATDPEGQTVTYSVQAGSLPNGLKLTANGIISGLLGGVTDDTEFFFTVAASDGVASTNRSFNFTTQLDSPPVWQTGSDLGIGIEGYPVDTTLVATSPRPLTYEISYGSAPNGLTLNSNTGVLMGTLAAVGGDVQTFFTVTASDGTKGVAQTFKFVTQKNYPPKWSSTGIVAQGFGGSFVDVQLVAPDPNGSAVFFSIDANSAALPDGISLTSGGVLSGTLPVVETLTDYSFTAVASDGVQTASRLLKIRALKNLNPVWTSNATLDPVLEEVSFSYQLVAIDPSGVQSISYSSTDLPSGLSLSNTGVLSGTTPSVTQDTTLTFTVTASNGVLSTDQTFSLVVKFNNPPVWVSNSGTLGSILALYPFSYSLQSNDADGTTNEYTLASGSLPDGLSLNVAGVISGNPSNVSNTTAYDFTVAISDGFNAPVTRDFSITVSHNSPAVWLTNANTSVANAFETAPISYTLQAMDPDGMPVIYYLPDGELLPAGLALSKTTGVLSGTLPHVDQDTVVSFTVFADDGSPFFAGRTLRSFDLTIKFNSPPIWTTTSLPSGIESTNYTYQLAATGVGNGPMIYTMNSGSLPAGLTLSKAGLISGTLPAAASDTTYTFTIEAYNGIKSANQTLSIMDKHNLPPVWNSNAGSVGSFLAGNKIDIQLVANDPNGSSVTYALSNSTSLPTGITMTSDGHIQGQFPITANTTVYDFTISVSDGVFYVPQNFSITALAEAAPIWTTAAGSLGTVFKGGHFNTYVVATDPQHSTITYSVVSGSLPSGISLNTTTGLVAGTAPEVDTNTTSTFTIRASDGTLTTDQVFSITIQSVQAPMWVTAAGSLGSLLSGYTGSFPFYATDPNGFALTYSIVGGSLPPAMNLGSGGGIFTTGMTPVPATNTTTVYTFTVQADNGDVQVTRTFSVTILANLAPVWANASGSLGNVNENVSVAIQLSAPDPEGQTVLYSLASGSLPGGLTLTSTGVLEGTTAVVTNTTTSSFTIQADDGVRQATRAFTFTVSFSTPPVFVTPAGSLGSALEQTAVSYTVNAASDGQTIHYAVATGSALPTGLNIGLSNGVISGVLPPTSSDTTTSFVVNATSTSSLKTSSQSFSITDIHNLPPVWSTDAGNFLTDLAGTSFTKTLLAIDPNGTKIIYSIANGTLPGSVTFNPNATSNTATLSGTLPTVSSDTSYSITIGAGDGATQVNRTFSFTSEFDTPPVWNTNAGVIANVTEQFSYSVTLMATDPQGKAVTYSISNGSLPSGATFYTGNGVLTGTAPAVANSVTGDDYNFTVIASDGTMTTPQNFDLHIKPNLPPVWTTANGSLGSVIEGQNFSQVQLVAVDPEGSTVTYSLANSTALPSGFSLTSGGLLTGHGATVANNTTYNFTVAASDGLKTTNRDFSVSVLFDTTHYDPYSNSVAVLMPMEGTTNDVVGGHTITVVGNAAIDASQAQYGNSSVHFDGSSYLSIPTNTDTSLNLFFGVATPLTIEFWSRPTSLTTGGNIPSGADTRSPCIWYQGSDDGTGGVPRYSYSISQLDNTFRFDRFSNGNGNTDFSFTIPSVGWYHHAIVRNSGSIKWYVNGSLVATVGAVGDVFAQAMYFGAEVVPNYTGASNYWTGNVDDVRITPVARYSANFTPGPAPIPPAWLTAAGPVSSVTEGQTFTANVVATDPFNLGFFNYSLVGGTTMPTGVSLNSTSGMVAGTMPQATGNAISFTLQDEDGNDNLSAFRSFSVSPTPLSAPASMPVSWRFNGPASQTNFGPTVGTAATTLSGGSVAAFAAAPAPHASDTALNLTSSTSLVAPTATNFAFLASSNWTVEMWVYLSTAGDTTHNYTLLSVGSALAAAVSSANNGNGFRLMCDSTGVWGFKSADLIGAQTAYMPALTTNAWNHIAIARDGSKITAFANGVGGTSITNASTVASTNFNTQNLNMNGFVGQSGFALPTTMLRAVNFFSATKYSENFTPIWQDFTAPLWNNSVQTVVSMYESTPINSTVVVDTFGGRSYTITNSTAMPAGLTLANGVLTGAFPAYNANSPSSTFTLQAVDNASVSAPPRTLTYTAISTAPAWVTNAALSNAPTGSYSQTFSATSIKSFNFGSQPASSVLGYSSFDNGVVYDIKNLNSARWVTPSISTVGSPTLSNSVVKFGSQSITGSGGVSFNFQPTSGDQTMTFEFWLNVNTMTAGAYLFENFSPADGAGRGYLFLNTDGSITTAGVSTSATKVTTGRWYYITLEFNNANTLLYIDGVLQWSTAFAGDFLGYTDGVNNFAFKSRFTGALPTDGYIDDLILWNGAIRGGVNFTPPTMAWGSPTITYSLANGSSLPTGLSLAANGVLSGTLPVVSSTTNYNFTINASDGTQSIGRTFSLIETAVVDAFAANTVILMPMTGTVGAQPTEAHGKTVTAVGTGAPLTAAQSKFGTQSAFISNPTAGGNFLEVPTTSMPGDATFEGWFYSIGGGDGLYIMIGNYGPSVGADAWLLFLSAGTVNFYYSASAKISAGSVSANAWNHIALVRHAGINTVYLNGTSIGTESGYVSDFGTSSSTFTIGGYTSSPSLHSYNGYANDVRITSAARYTSNFTPTGTPDPIG
jgi:hypothetical protein